MATAQTSEQQIKDLEERVKKLEDKVLSPAQAYDDEYMAQLYRKAKDLVVRNNKATVIFLQRRLIIDFTRAARLMDELENNGVIGPATGIEPRKILVKK